MSDGWLQNYILDSINQNICTRAGCTTCGANQFRRGLLQAFAAGTEQIEPSFLHRECALQIASALTSVKSGGDWKFEEAIRCILIDLWSAAGGDTDGQLSHVLQGSWAGQVLDSMRHHSAEVEARRRALAEYQSPAAVQQRREEKKRLKQQRHEERLALKKERDRIWFEKQGSKS